MDNTRRINIISLALLMIILIIPMWNISNNISRLDMFFSYNQYIFFRENPDCINLPIFMSIYAGHLIVLLSEKISVSPILLGNMAVAIIQYMGALSIYLLLKKRMPRNIILAGIIFGLLHEKASTGFNMFFYSFLSMYALLFLLVTLIYGIEKQKNSYIILSGLLAGLAVFIRISNAVYLLSYLILFVGHNKNDGCILKFLFALIGIVLGIAISFTIIHSTIGIESYMQLFDVIADSAIDSHDVLSLLFFTFDGLKTGALVALSVLFLGFFIHLIDKKLLGLSVKYSHVFIFSSLVTAVFIASDGFGIINITSPRTQFIASLLSCYTAVFFIAASCFAYFSKRMPLFWKRYTIASVFFCLLGPFGSNTVFTLLPYGSLMLYPLIFIILYRLSEYKREEGIYKAMNWYGKGACCLYGGTAVICFFTAAVRTVSHWQYPFFSKELEYKDMPAHFLLNRMKGNPALVSCYSTILKELTPFIKPGNFLISFDYPDVNALLSCPPFLKWKGGQTGLTYSESLKEQLESSARYPVILIPRSYKAPNKDKKLDYACEFAQSHSYSRAETENYIIYLPPASI